MTSHIYILRIVQQEKGDPYEYKYAFSRLSNLQLYLQDLWNYMGKTLSRDNLERVPPLPAIGELRAGIEASAVSANGYKTYEVVGIGFVESNEPLSLYMDITKMIVY